MKIPCLSTMCPSISYQFAALRTKSFVDQVKLKMLDSKRRAFTEAICGGKPPPTYSNVMTVIAILCSGYFTLHFSLYLVWDKSEQFYILADNIVCTEQTINDRSFSK